MEQQATSTNVPFITLATFLNAMRRVLKALQLAKGFHAIRRGIHFGPWRGGAKAVIRALRPKHRAAIVNGATLLPQLDPDGMADRLRDESMVVAGALPADFVLDLRSITDRLAVNQYMVVDEVDANFRRLAQDLAILAVLRAYFGCEPVLLEATLLVTKAHNTRPDDLEKRYHLDYGGWDSLNVMVYLTDVFTESSCHVVIKGSHRTMSYLDAVRGGITAHEARRRFAPAITEIVGPAGLVFFENTEAFHQRRRGNSRRVMLNLLYASHRAWFSRGRASRRHLEKRARAFAAARAAAAEERGQLAQISAPPQRFSPLEPQGNL